MDFQKYNKYKVAPKADRTYKSIVFASKGEMERYQELEIQESLGQIRNLALQPAFELEVEGQLVCKYIADFSYDLPDGKPIIEDFKGVVTAVFRIKKNLFEILYPKLNLVISGKGGTKYGSPRKRRKRKL